ncbi:MAG: glycosyltransferase [Kiritimatiellae bacterium]|nr:glycosyltransferase [Kiritimatiellia bacterium]
MKDSLRLCLSLYACEPNRGSEPGVGWAWALGMAKRHETWVITRANNREVIEAELDRRAVPPADRPHFVWVDLPRWVVRLKKRGAVPVGLYYFLWQFAARRAWDRTGTRADVIHHVTFCSYVLPGAWWHRKEKVVLGPLGGTAVCARPFLAEFPPFCRFVEWKRGIGRRLWFLDPFFLRSRASADALLFVDRDSASRMGDRGRDVSLMLDVAVPGKLLDDSFGMARRRRRQFVWAGTLAGHKAGGVALRAFAQAFGRDQDQPRFVMFGKGPDRARLERLAAKLGVSANVSFRGNVPQTELWAAIRDSLGFVFTSVRDTCGSVSVEALACGTPLVCFKHQGVGEVVDGTCGIAVKPGTYHDAVSGFASAMRRLAGDPELANRLGAAGRKRAIDMFTWEHKFDKADEIYRNVLSPRGHTA